MQSLFNWLDDRTGYRGFLDAVLYRTIPGGPHWQYVWGSTLLFGVLVQFITGFFLWMSYSPNAQSAWESVYYIQHELWGGWLLRGIHHYAAQVMVILLAIHLVQVIVSGAYKAPREVNFWLGIVLMLMILGASFTGYLLPWDQRGYMATTVASSIAGSTPGVGGYVQQLLLGGSQLGHHTLTRFFALHAGLIPALLVTAIGLHVVLARRTGLLPLTKDRTRDVAYFPDQFQRDVIACLVVLAAILGLSMMAGVGPRGGAHLGPPADLSAPFDAARPEWYFLFLFQFLHFFSGGTEVIGSQIIPGLVLATVAAMPLIARWQHGHRFNLSFLFSVMAGILFLMGMALFNDYATHPVLNGHYEKALAFQAAVRDSEQRAHRAVELAQIHGIGPEGAAQLVRRDPFIQGGALFSKHCATCHSYSGHDGTGRALKSPPVAADLGHFGTRDWLRGMLTEVISDRHFGRTSKGRYDGKDVGDRFLTGSMATWVQENVTSKKLKDEEIAALVEFMVTLNPDYVGERPANAKLAEQGKTIFGEGTDAVAESCYLCHAVSPEDPYFKDLGDPGDTGPDLTGYGSKKWLKEFIKNPGDSKFYGSDNAMPPFASKMTEHELDMLVDWMLKRWPRLPESAPTGGHAPAPAQAQATAH